MPGLKLVLVPYQESFLKSFLEWRDQPSSRRHNPLKTMTRDQIAGMLRSEGSQLQDLRTYESYRWFVKTEDQVVGALSLKNISHSMQYAEIGYGISEDHHNQGIATAALRLLIDRIFMETNLRRLIAYVHDQNIPSQRVLEKLGFRQEGIMREHYVINGRAVNEVVYGLLRNEWTSSR